MQEVSQFEFSDVRYLYKCRLVPFRTVFPPQVRYGAVTQNVERACVSIDDTNIDYGITIDTSPRGHTLGPW